MKQISRMKNIKPSAKQFKNACENTHFFNKFVMEGLNQSSSINKPLNDYENRLQPV